MREWLARSATRSPWASTRARVALGGSPSMDERLREILSGEDAWIIGGAVRDELLLRPVLDVDVACADPRDAAHRFAKRFGGAVFPLSERHGAWRVVAAESVETGESYDPHDGRGDLRAGVVRAVTDTIFVDDPHRLLRAVRFEDELGFRMDERTESLLRASAPFVMKPAGERVLSELERLSAAG